MSDVNWNTNLGFSCNMTQTWFSNSYHSGATAGDASQKTKSKGNPSWKSDASKTASNMVDVSGGGGNPLQITNYMQNAKWGNTLITKWSLLTTRPDPYEKSSFYEGEKVSIKHYC